MIETLLILFCRFFRQKILLVWPAWQNWFFSYSQQHRAAAAEEKAKNKRQWTGTLSLSKGGFNFKFLQYATIWESLKPFSLQKSNVLSGAVQGFGHAGLCSELRLHFVLSLKSFISSNQTCNLGLVSVMFLKQLLQRCTMT